DDAGQDSAAALVWGLMRSLAIEHTEARPIRIDLDPSPGDGEAGALLAELLSGAGEEEEVAYRAGVRYVARLREHAPRAPVKGTAPRPRRTRSRRAVAGAGGVLD